MMFVVNSALTPASETAPVSSGSSCSDGTSCRDGSTSRQRRRPSASSVSSSHGGSVCASPPNSMGAPTSLTPTPPQDPKPVLSHLPKSPCALSPPSTANNKVLSPKSPSVVAFSGGAAPRSPLLMQPRLNHRNTTSSSTSRLSCARLDEDSAKNNHNASLSSTASSWLMDGSTSSYSKSTRRMKSLQEEEDNNNNNNNHPTTKVLMEDESLHDFYHTESSSPQPPHNNRLHNSLSALQTNRNLPRPGMQTSFSSLPLKKKKSRDDTAIHVTSSKQTAWQGGHQSLSAISSSNVNWTGGSQSAPSDRKIVTRHSLSGGVPLVVPTPAFEDDKAAKLPALTNFQKGSSSDKNNARTKKSSKVRTIVAVIGVLLVSTLLVGVFHHRMGPFWHHWHLTESARRQERQDALVAILQQQGITTQRLLHDTDSDAHRALLWMAHEDPMQLPIATEESSQTAVLLQRFTLAAFYFATHKHHPHHQPLLQLDDGDHNNHYNPHHTWHNETLWMTDAPVCEWHGISCELVEQSDWFDATLGSSASASDATRVLQEQSDDNSEQQQDNSPPVVVLDIVRIDLSKQFLQGTVPPEIRYLSQLTALDLSHNHMTGTLPQDADVLGHFLRLTDLRLNHNLLTGVLPESLANNMILKHVYLDHNHFRGTIPLSYGHNWRNLYEFSLSFNQLTGPLPSTMGGLKHIRVLEWNDNQLTGELPFGLSLLKSIEHVDLRFNHLAGSIPSEFFNSAKHLRVFHLGHNLITGHIPDEFTHMALLETFQVQHNEMSGRLPKTLGQLSSNLKNLEINHNHFTGWVPSEWGEIETLQVLRVQNNQLGGKVPVQLAKLTNLEEFQLQNNLVQPTLSKKIKRRLPNLRLFDIGIYASQARGDALQIELAEEAKRALHEPVVEEEEEDDEEEAEEGELGEKESEDEEGTPLLSIVDNFAQLHGVMAPGNAHPQYEDEEM
ncbi:STYKc [Seminavis robusta]|uniref:STYKc n=1 Tax=Seminavis robusta TaxID=568900 RepID=A0A9N8DB41_9STRA|nr:STYKc [Seminavis robusta]|eukprot:Sro5_g004480.1 STYKc (952) ;mRNA; f:163246-166297